MIDAIVGGRCADVNIHIHAATYVPHRYCMDCFAFREHECGSTEHLEYDALAVLRMDESRLVSLNADAMLRFAPAANVIVLFENCR